MGKKAILRASIGMTLLFTLGCGGEIRAQSSVGVGAKEYSGECPGYGAACTASFGLDEVGNSGCDCGYAHTPGNRVCRISGYWAQSCSFGVRETAIQVGLKQVDVWQRIHEGPSIAKRRSTHSLRIILMRLIQA